MERSEDEPIFPPTVKELESALWVASYADTVVRSFIETGHPEPDAFISLCSSLEGLRGHVIGGIDFHERAEDLHGLLLKDQPK
jgi:hypothetical protein